MFTCDMNKDHRRIHHQHKSRLCFRSSCHQWVTMVTGETISIRLVPSDGFPLLHTERRFYLVYKSQSRNTRFQIQLPSQLDYLNIVVTMTTKHNIASCGMYDITVVSMRQIIFNPRGTACMVGLACLRVPFFCGGSRRFLIALAPRMLISWSQFLKNAITPFLTCYFLLFCFLLACLAHVLFFLLDPASTQLFPLHNRSRSPLVDLFWPKA